jgi:carboxymethylenebutenolidase
MGFRNLQAGTVAFDGHNGTRSEAYYAHPTGPGPFPGVVVIHHFPGWDEWTAEVARKFAHHGYAAIAPNLYVRLGDGGDSAIVAQARAEGGMPDDQVVGDVAGAAVYLRAQPHANGKVGVIGFCSGGRHALLCACKLRELNAAVDCWGGNVVVDKSKLTARQPVAVIDLLEGLSGPLLGLFGNEDPNPSPADVDRTEAELKRLDKSYDFHRYDGAGHAFFAWYRENYRQQQAQDGWDKVLGFFNRHLA